MTCAACETWRAAVFHEIAGGHPLVARREVDRRLASEGADDAEFWHAVATADEVRLQELSSAEALMEAREIFDGLAAAQLVVQVNVLEAAGISA